MRRWLVAFALAVTVAQVARAHEVRPAFLEIRQTAADAYEVMFKVPTGGESMRAGLAPQFPEDTVTTSPPRWTYTADAAIETMSIRRPGGLAGSTISVANLPATTFEVLVRVAGLDGGAQVVRLTPSEPSFVIPQAPSRWRVAGTYLRLGWDHILFGIDHLLFVLGLLLIVPDRWMLFRTITSFTLAHSLTLAAATLGLARAPVAPIEAAIAMSILFLGPEIVRHQRGGTSLTIRHPWVVAFIFGLLHGFGFASGLAEIGLPQGEIPLALLCFNLGVEIGQLSFVALMLVTARALRGLTHRWPRALELAPAYLVGTLGAFWAIQRTAIAFGAGR
jgi:hydrogenase/urease accessory protein HupE